MASSRDYIYLYLPVELGFVFKSLFGCHTRCVYYIEHRSRTRGTQAAGGLNGQPLIIFSFLPMPGIPRARRAARSWKAYCYEGLSSLRMYSSFSPQRRKHREREFSKIQERPQKDILSWHFKLSIRPTIILKCCSTDAGDKKAGTILTEKV